MMKDGGHHGDEETTMTAKIERRVPFRHLARTVTPTVVIVMLLGLGSPVGATTSSSVALSITEYALATATHDRPAHVVTAADITNATGINTVNTKNLYVLINLGDVFGYSRLVLFFDQKLFSDICVNFPNTVGGAPGIIACPHQAQGLWNSRAGALGASDRAVADAAARGHSVSGADVVAAAKIYQLKLVHKPTFRAGQGGVVTFSTLVEMGGNTKFTVNNCVSLPKTAFGIPVEVAC
jgi:flavin reductase (DIM6/NTAB) family NADH-FMN oxidoreductase RutF